MKKHFGHKTTALFCFISLLIAIGMTGCAKTGNENSSEKSSQTISSSEISEPSDDNSPPSTPSEASDKSSQPSAPSDASDENSPPSEASTEESSEVSAGDFSYSEDGNGSITLTKYNGKGASPELPSSIGGKAVTAVGESCFAGNTSVRKIVLPEGIADVGDYAFECCANLEEVSLPDSLKTIGEGSFSACTRLSAIELPENTEVIKKGAFLYCQSLTSIELPESIRELGNFAFSNCSSVTSVTFRGDKVKELPDRLFYSCKKLTEININYTLDSIGKRTFAQCESLTSVSLPGELQSVSDYAFQSCSELKEVSINALSVSETAYAGCYQLPEEMLPKPQDGNDDSEIMPQSSDEASKPDTLGSIAGDGSLFDEEKFAGYRIISNDEFSEWSQRYLDFCKENGVPTERDELFYTMLYKGEVIPHFMGMTSAENHDPAMSKEAANAFGDDYEETYLMMDHGLYTELKRGRMCDDLVLYSGVYDSQLMAAAGTSEVPTLEQLKDCIGNTFTDPIMISTTTDIEIACNFSDTLFIIYASKESVDRLGAISIDSIIGTMEKEILMSKNASYRILDVGTMAVKTTDYNDNETEIYRNYIKLELL